MKTARLAVLLALATIALSALACGGSFTTARIADAWLATDEEGANRTTTFSQDATFNLFVELKNAPEDTKLKASWIAVDAEATEANTVVYETEYTSSDDTIRFFLENEDLWPAGSYRVDIYLDGELDRSVAFTVQ